jgi:hypothetical protein
MSQIELLNVIISSHLPYNIYIWGRSAMIEIIQVRTLSLTVQDENKHLVQDSLGSTAS